MNKKIKLAIGIAVWVSIASNQDAALAAKNMGIKNSYQYSSDYDGTRNMYEKEKRSRM